MRGHVNSRPKTEEVRSPRGFARACSQFRAGRQARQLCSSGANTARAVQSDLALRMTAHPTEMGGPESGVSVLGCLSSVDGVAPATPDRCTPGDAFVHSALGQSSAQGGAKTEAHGGID